MPIYPLVVMGAIGAGAKVVNWFTNGGHRRLSSAAFRWGGFEDVVLHVVDDWKSEPMASEVEYQNSLFEHMVSRNDSCRIEKEFPYGGSRFDLYVEYNGIFSKAEAAIELKFNLQDRREFQRLLSQIVEYESSKRFLLIVLCGETKSAFLTRLMELYRSDLEKDGFASPRMAIRCVR